jgi:UDP-N-acetylmuramate: L-alanyl-gamma-D-glutamyl-meso-diaminopimelate ligase
LHESEFTVLEGDEYDTCFFDKGPKFAHYLPELAILNAVELDQMDIYPDIAAVKRAFGLLLRVVPANGVLLYNVDDANACDVAALSKTKTQYAIGLGEQATTRITHIETGPGGTVFTLLKTRFALPMFGEFNVRNAAMAIVAAHHYGISLADIENAVATFKGVLRRQVLRGEARGVKIIEDFGKHPTNLRETLRALGLRFPGARVWAVVEPKANTMCRAEIYDALAAALKEGHGALMAPVDRPERFGAGEALDVPKLVAELTAAGHPSYAESGPDSIVERLKEISQPGDVVAVFSSGGFGGIYAKLLAM